jgi:hypothetical protein
VDLRNRIGLIDGLCTLQTERHDKIARKDDIHRQMQTLKGRLLSLDREPGRADRSASPQVQAAAIAGGAKGEVGGGPEQVDSARWGIFFGLIIAEHSLD